MSRTPARLALGAAVAAAFLGSAAPAHAGVIAPPCSGYVTINSIQAPAYANCMVDFTAGLVVSEGTCLEGYDPLTPATIDNMTNETVEFVYC